MAVSIDQQFIEYIVKSIVNDPDSVKINRRIDEKGVLLELSVNPEDLGRVIGKRGATAQSLRTLLRALGTKNDARYNLKIVDTGDGAPRPARQDDKAQDDDIADEPAGDDNAADKPKDEDSAEEPAPETEAPAEEDKDKEKDESDVVSRTRAELAELDDLDV